MNRGKGNDEKRQEVCHEQIHEQREWMNVPRWKRSDPCFGWLSMMFTLNIVTLYQYVYLYIYIWRDR